MEFDFVEVLVSHQATALRATVGAEATAREGERSAWPLEMVLCAYDAGWRIRNVPVEYREREGRSKVTGTVRGTWRAVGDMGRLLRARGR